MIAALVFNLPFAAPRRHRTRKRVQIARHDLVDCVFARDRTLSLAHARSAACKCNR